MIRSLYIGGLLIAAITLFRSAAPDDWLSGLISGALLGMAGMEVARWIIQTMERRGS